MIDYLIALALTQVIELAVALLLGYREKYVLLSIVFINFITHPILNYIILINSSNHFFELNIFTVTFLELIVVLVEWLLFIYVFGKDKKAFFKLAFLMNFASYTIGLLIYPLS